MENLFLPVFRYSYLRKAKKFKIRRWYLYANTGSNRSTAHLFGLAFSFLCVSILYRATFAGYREIWRPCALIRFAMSSSSPPQPQNTLLNPFTRWNCSHDIADTPPNKSAYGSLHRTTTTRVKKETEVEEYSWSNVSGSMLARYLYLNLSTATDMCLGCSGHVYRFLSSSGSRSTSWKMKQSKGRSFKASTYPTFMSIARLKASLPGKRRKLLDRSSRKSEAKGFEQFRAWFLSNEIRFTFLCTLVLGQRTRFRNEYSSIKSFASYLFIGGLERTGEAGEKVGRELYLRSTLRSFHYSFNILQTYAGVKSFCQNVIISLPRNDSRLHAKTHPIFWMAIHTMRHLSPRTKFGRWVICSRICK